MNKAFSYVKDVLMILAGALIFALGINYFAIPNKLGEGGLTGIALLAHYLFGWSPGYLILGLNIPLFLIGYRVFGLKTFVYTLIGTGAVSFFLELTAGIGKPHHDLLLVSLYTGVLIGIGLGLIFRAGGTTGGVDIIARLLNRFFGWSIGRTFMVFDFAVISLSTTVIGLDMGMYTLVAVFIGARVVDFVVEGLNASKAATIISNQSLEIANQITTKMNRGVTILKGKGAYTGQDKQVLYVVFSPTEFPKLKEIVERIDPYAFLVVHDVRDVQGEGFTFEKEMVEKK